ncbi:MAG TPA: glucoamylase family protein [Bryobacteraceae bacterium]|nr:glucoamylase family protein [Bryobacteraceae bacterium]
MKQKPLRLVLAFYSGDEEEPNTAYRSVREAGSGRVFLFSAGAPSKTGRPAIDRYAALRLEGETLVAVEAPAEKLENIVRRLQDVGSPAVFALREDSANLSAPGEQPDVEPSTGGSPRDLARQCAERRAAPHKTLQSIFGELQENELALDASRRDLAEAARLGHALTAAAEWLLDNAYLIRTQIAEIRRHFPRGYAKHFLSLAPAYDLAQELVASSDQSLSEDNISEWLREYQTVAPLSIAELWLFPLLLRLALVQMLRRLAARVSRAQQIRETAYLWANRLAAGARRGSEQFEFILRRMESDPLALEPYFLTSLVEQLQDEENALVPIQRWIEEHLQKSITELVRGEHTREAAERVSTANAFGSLRVLAGIDFTAIFEAVSLVEAELHADPIYLASDFATRDQCRRVVERISRNSGWSELDVAREALHLAAQGNTPQTRHASYYLLAGGVTQLEAATKARVPLKIRFIRAVRERAIVEYLFSISGLTACFLLLALALAWDGGVYDPLKLALLGALALFPLSELSVQIVNALAISLLPPEPLPKMDFKRGIPAEDATLVVVPMLLANRDVIQQQLEKLEVRFLANREPNLYFSLLSDFTDAPEQDAPGDAELLRAASDGIADLNARYSGGHFLLFHRPRVWSQSEGMWIGRERKRGKIEELNEYLSGSGSGEIRIVGTVPLPVRYVITLDSDTRLPPGAARRMVETISHPLNRVEIDPKRRVRLRGYTIIQPRVSIGLPDATATRFTRVFADTTGTDPYCQTVSDAHQDLFGEAIFHGKAIYDVQAFRTTLEDRFPEETLLSHDLIEGAHAGVGLASDIELFENLPLDYVSFSKRQHRWIRGDWQIAPWIFPRVPAAGGGREPNPLTLLNRWRILDNLRRSLVPVASLLLLLFGWLISAAPGVWSLVVGLAVAIPALAPLLDRLARRVQREVHGWRGAADELLRAAVMIAFLPHQAWLAIDAIARVTYRRKVTHRRLLEWETAEAAAKDVNRRTTSTLRQMLVISGVSVILMIVLGVKGAFAPTSAFLLLWFTSPAILIWLSRPTPAATRVDLSRTETLILRRLARRTWRYFDDLVNDESNWLPPDNSQLALHVEVAQRTSPTNIGFWFTSALTAADLGYLTVDDFVSRCTRTFATLDRLERYEGHLLNWYDTRTLQPLIPRYVSTVDSGNLIASLWVLQKGCEDLLQAPLLGPSCLKALADTLAILREASGRDASVSMPIQALRRLLHGSVTGHVLISRLRLALNPVQQLQESGRWQEAGGERSYWISALARELESWTAVVGRYLPWMETLIHPPDSFLSVLSEDAPRLRRLALGTAVSLEELSHGMPAPLEELLDWRGRQELRPEIAAWLDQLAADYHSAQTAALETSKRLSDLSHAASVLSAGINMRFLYDAPRRLFGVGYAVGGPVEFTSHYDLLASECRLASLVAIASGAVPTEHWFALSRPIVSTGRRQTLLSWSGTMFEFLMPLLFTRTFTNSLLDYACRQAVRLQIEYGRRQDVPWGVSECAYSALDASQTYQYRAFGVPDLALKPGLEDDLVVAPYAAILALTVDAGAAVENLERLQQLGLEGPMGFYESIDFSRENKRSGERGVVIYAYMAHHQGMNLAALDDALNGHAMQRRFHDDVRIRAVESLLFERMPITRMAPDVLHTTSVRTQSPEGEEPAERTWKEETALPRVHLQGNGRYSLMVTNAGGGYSRWKDFDLTRWRSDTTRDPWGSFLYIRDLQSGTVWAAAHQPTGSRMGSSLVTFSADRAEFQRRLFGVETVMDVTVAAEDDVELRRVTITNRSARSRSLEFTSYQELALAPHRTDTAHPAFAKMFVQTERAAVNVLFAHRRLRSPGDPPIWAAHILLGAPGQIQYETDRAVFLGRGCGTDMPQAVRRDLTGSAGTVLDPIFSLRCRVTLQPRDRIQLDFITIAADSREALLALVSKYQRQQIVTRAFEMAWTRAQLEFRYLGVGPAAANRFQELASHLLYPNSRLRPVADRLIRNHLGQSVLWAYGISGDLPILAITAAEPRHLPLFREVLLAHSYWRLRGLRVDLLVLNQEGASYDQPFRQQLLRQVQAHASEAGMDKPGGIFLRDWNAIPEEHRNLLLAVSSAVLNGVRGSLQRQLTSTGEAPPPPPFSPSGNTSEVVSPPLPFLELPYFNGTGGFTQDGQEYAIYLKPGSRTPAPWANVMANPSFGALVSESGLGFTWCGNSQSNRLTPWKNDPVSDPPSEAIYLRDEESGATWTPTALPIREQDAYRARHGQGYTVFEHNSHAIGQELTVFVPMGENGAGDPVKVYRLRLRNDSGRQRRLAVTYFAELVLGGVREDQQLHVQTSRDEPSGAVIAKQYWTGTYAGQIAFAAASPRAASYSGDRTQFLGRNRSAGKPLALERARLDNRTGAAIDPAAALQVPVAIDAGQQVEVTFLLGQAETVDKMREVVGRYQSADQVESALASTRGWWDSTLSALHVRTPLLSTDLMLNRWLPYQALSCRFWGRSALYQSSGAFGFRDQLQDCLAFLYIAPELTRAHILASAARQFLEGDVQHWWHRETGLGVRTRCSDDMVWLPFAVEHYVRVTGDTGILDQEIPFLEGAPLKDGEEERVFIPAASAETAPLWQHCQRALDHASRLGAHGLPLFGTGDWNDGMNRVGIEGRGESVWLAWFLCAVLRPFADLMESRKDGRSLAAAWREQAGQLSAALEKSSWDGDWYLRGFFDNGAPLGSHANPEAKIDSLPQSWAVISGAANPERARRAMESAQSELVIERDRLALLFTPPFDHSEPHPGYIMGYPPGIRENGGQYTHGSLWMAAAWARLGDGDAAVRLLTMMNPIENARNPKAVEHYCGEPYVVAADVSSAPGRRGQSGWTWYTGSAGWMYRIWIEEVLGFRLRGDQLTIAPVIPDAWDGFEISYRYRGSLYEIKMQRSPSQESWIEFDGHRFDGATIQLIDDGRTHQATVSIPRSSRHSVVAPQDERTEADTREKIGAR